MPVAVSIVPANEASWEDLQTILGTRSYSASCQCQRFKTRGRQWDSEQASVPVEERARRLRMQTRCGQPEADTTSGLVAYLDGEPVGWCAVEPRTAYVRLGRVPWAGRAEDEADDGVWAVSCFMTRPGFRRRGVTAHRLLGGLDARIGVIGRRGLASRSLPSIRPKEVVVPSKEPSMSGLETLMSGIAFGESPRWHHGRLWFADWVAQEVVAVDLDGNSEVITRVQSLPFSIDWLPEGRLLITSGRNLLRMEPDGSLVTHVDLSNLTDYGWNEIVVDGRGNTYVNGPEFDLMAGEEFRPGIIALVAPDGSARRVADGIAFPNGMAVTPDDSTLIVAESYGKKLTAFDIDPDGSLSNTRVWADLGDDPPDGICMDAEGAVWYGTVPNKRCVRVGEGGEVLHTIDLDLGCFACMLGGADGRTLFMMAQEWGGTGGMADGPRTGKVLTAEAPSPGAGRP